MAEEKSVREQLRQKAARAVVTDAFLRWESAVTIALTMLLVFFVPNPFTWWQPWFWVVGGGLALLALIIAHVTDPNSAALAVTRMFQDRYNPGDIRNSQARRRFERALEYRTELEKLVLSAQGSMRTSLQHTLDEVDTWIANVYHLAVRMDDFERNSIIMQDRETVPQELNNMRRRLEVERSPTVRQELESAIRLKQQQLENLRRIDDGMKRADIRLDNTLAALGTIYAQMQVLDYRDLDGGRARRLQEDIHDEVEELQDTILAMDEVYSGSRLAG